MKILFMGSGDFALPILQKLHGFHQICAVYTAPFDQQNTRKKVVNEVEIFCLENGLKLHQESKITDEVVADVKNYNPDVIVVASYGFLLPQSLLEIGVLYKPINVHPSILPRWRGAAPIERALEAGDEETSVCVMKMVKKMDAGDVLLQQNLAVDSKINAIDLRKKTAEIGGDLVLKWLEKPTDGFIQSDFGVTHAKKIDKIELLLDFGQSVFVLHNKIRAFVSSGGCYFVHNGERIKILQADYSLCNVDNVGFVDTSAGKIFAKDGVVIPIIMQREGKKAMPAVDVFRGLK